jgi:hypothetical protein
VFRRHAEIWYSLAAIVVVTAVYLVAYQQAGAFPAASGLVGHGIGILGFMLMLMTEILYSIRKQLTDARWGNMAGWLKFHIVTGLVGPYMVLLHTSMRFQGLAGVLTLLTVVVVISGIVGRYIYTAAPHAVRGNELGLAEPDFPIAAAAAGSAGPAIPEGTLAAVLAPSSPGSDPAMAGQTPEAGGRRGGWSIPWLTADRGALATWRSIHIPLTLTLFVLAFVHVVAALYYATLQR